MSRITGLYNIRSKEWEKVVYFHCNANGESCVNGEPVDIILHRAGDDFQRDDGYALVVSRDIMIPTYGYLAVNEGECLLWVDEDVALSVCSSGFVGVSSKISFWRQMKVGVLTISDKGSKHERVDTAGPALADMVEALGGSVSCRDIVPDERDTISEKLKSWADDERLHLILTTGGTGLSGRDVTPEALMDIRDKIVPGFGEVMRARSLLYTPRGFLTRSIAVIRRNTLIIAFPGSERAVRQCFEAISPALRHGVEILSGWDSECGGHH